MNEELSDLPQADGADPDGVQVALRAAHTLWSRGDTTESLKWLRKAAESASDEGADLRSLQLAKAAAELRAKLFGGNDAQRLPAPSEVSGAHPIAGEVESLRAAASMASAAAPARASQAPSAPLAAGPAASGQAAEDILSGAAAPHDTSGSLQRPVVTATQYPSHRPRQRMGLTSSSYPPPPSARSQDEDGQYDAGLPAWAGASSERRLSAAPPPLPSLSLDDYEELEAEPDDDPEQPGDDPASIWSSSPPESWRSAEGGGAAERQLRASSAAQPSGSALPPPLPPRSAFDDDELDDDGQPPDPPTRVMPPLEEGDGDEHASYGDRDRTLSDSYPGSAWDQQSRAPASGGQWDGSNGTPSSWGNELRGAGWGSSPSNAASEAANEAGLSPSEAARPKLTARVHHQAVRVSFAPDQRVPGQYVVRALREGEKAAAGERVALLVALEPGVPLV